MAVHVALASIASARPLRRAIPDEWIKDRLSVARPSVVEGSEAVAEDRHLVAVKRSARGVEWKTVRQLARRLPGVEEGTSYGTPAFRVGRKFLGRLRDNGKTLVVKIAMDERDAMIAVRPDVFFITDHYRDYPAVLVHLSEIEEDELEEVLELAWRDLASPRLQRLLDGE